MSLLQKIVADLGAPYTIRKIDGEYLIHRELDTGYELEVSGILSLAGKCVLYVWAINPHIMVGMYSDIPVVDLKDILGHFAFKYRNLGVKIQVERED